MLPENYDSLHGWCTRKKATVMMDYIRELKPTLSVELGVFGGRSLLAIALESKSQNPQSKVIGVDAWESNASVEGSNDKANDDWWSNINYTEIMNYASDLMKTNNVNSVVELWKAKSSDVSHKFKENSIDFLHQDSNHSEEISCSEVNLYWNKVRPGGLWVFDDVNWETTKKAQQLLLTKGYTEIYSETPREWAIYKRD
jgi:predicted O-methyltransferase YrrM